MEHARFLACLDADEARLRAVAPIAPTMAVPTCPGWTVADLTGHVGTVYLHKTAAMRDGAEPEVWPPAGIADEDAFALLDRAYAGLVDEFASRKPSDMAGTWYKPDQTVGFWMRRMAQETVIHRIDAELGTGQPVAPVPADLAVDGVDELLEVFLAYSVAEWGSSFTEVLAGSQGWTYGFRTDDASWLVRSAPGRMTVEAGAGAGPTDVTIAGPPTALLRWVWNREAIGEPSQVTVEGPAEAVELLRRCIVIATQ